MMATKMRLHESITPERVTQAVEEAMTSLDNPGFCRCCGVQAEGVEPDAQGYVCESCGAPQVWGAEQLLIEMM